MPTPVLDLDAKQLVSTGGARQFTRANVERFSSSDAAFELSGSSYTIACWVYLDDIGSSGTFASKNGGPADRGYFVDFNAGANAFRFVVSGDGSAQTGLIGSGSVAAGRWYFIVAEHDIDTDTLTLLVDNSTSDDTPHSTGQFDASVAFELGANASVVLHNGRISRAGLWSRVLTSAEKTYLYNSGNGRTAAELGTAGTDGSDLLTNLVEYWNLNEASGDAIGNINGLDLTDNNTVTAANGPSAVNAADESSNENHGILTGFTASQAITSWKRDTGRLVLDESANDYHGSPVGNSVDMYSADVPSAIGSGYSLRLQSANSEYVDLSQHVSNFNTANASVSFWFKGTNDTAQAVFSFSDASSSDYTVVYVGDGASGSLTNELITILTRNASGTENAIGYTTATRTELFDGEWHHVLVVAGASGYQAFLDGSEVALTTGGGSNNGDWQVTSPTVAYIGTRDIGGGKGTYLDGRLDELRIYDSDESANVSTLAAGGDVAGYLARYSFDEGPADGLSLEFDGSDDYVDVQNSAFIDFPITVSTWVKTTDADGPIVSHDDGTNNGWRIEVAASKLTFRLGGVGTSGFNLLPDIDDGAWHHVAVSVDADNGTATGYVDGQSQGEAIGILSGTPDRFQIGSTNWWVAALAGLVDDVRVYDEVLSATQIMELAEGGDPTGATAVRHWAFDDGPQGTPGDGDLILSWTDRRSGKRCVQATASKRPSYTAEDTDFANDWASLTFDGTDDLLRLGESFLGGQAGTVVMAVKVTDTGAEQAILSASDEATATDYLEIGVETGNLAMVDDNTNQVEGSTTIAGSGSSHIISLTSDGSSWSIRVDGADETENVVSGSNAGTWFGDLSGPDNLVLGATKHTSEVRHFGGKVARIQVYEGELTAQEIQTAENELLVPEVSGSSKLAIGVSVAVGF